MFSETVLQSGLELDEGGNEGSIHSLQHG